MRMNGMSAAELVASIGEPDAAIDYGVDQFVAKRVQIDAFMARISELVPKQVLLLNFLPELRSIADAFMDGYRTVSADRDVSDDIPDCPEIDPGDLRLRTINPRGTDDLPVNVPVALYRDGNTYTRVYCWGETTLDVMYNGLRRAGPTTEEILRNPLQRSRVDPGCDLNILPESMHDHSSLRATGVWPVQRGDFVIFLRYCSACDAALQRKYEIGPCKIEAPWGIG